MAVEITEVPASPLDDNPLPSKVTIPAKKPTTTSKMAAAEKDKALPLTDLIALRAADKAKPRRIGKGSPISTRVYRQIKYPWAWLLNRFLPNKPVDRVKVMSRYLPAFYVIPKNREDEVLPYVKRHVIQLKSGSKLIALRDIKGCRDSRRWYEGKKQTFESELVLLKYTKELIEELDVMSDKVFGRNLKQYWDSCILRAEEEIDFQKRVRSPPVKQ